MTSERASGSNPRHYPAVLVPALGSLSCGVLTLVLGGYVGSVFLVVFAAIFVVAGVFILRLGRFGYILAMAVSALFLVIFAPIIPSGLTQMADFVDWLFTLILAPALVITLVYSVAGIGPAWRRNVSPPSGRMIPISTLLAILTVGFVIGGAAIGAIANGQIVGVVHASKASAEIAVAPGASNGIALPFFPANFTTKVGGTVTWVNNDTVTHTVTSVKVPPGAKPFDSGNMNYGFKFSMTFTVPGTYTYYCALHPFMKGTITVTP